MKTRNLTDEETKAIDRLKKAFRKLPSSFQIWATGTSIMIVDVDTKQVFDVIYTPNDGGNVGTKFVDGVEFLALPQ